MTTKSRSSHLRSCVVRGAAAMLALAFVSSAMAADPSKNVVVSAKRSAQAPRKTAKCYIWVTGYGMPIPCEQMSGAVPTTSKALITISNRG